MSAPGSERWRRLAGNRNLQVGLAMLAALLLAGAFGPWLVRWDPIEIDFAAALQRPGSAHPFGTDELGRDVLARVLAATFVDLKVVAVCVVLPFFIGSLIGLASGYYGGWFDRGLMRLVDVLLAFPHYVLVIAIVGSLGPGIANLYLAFALVVWISFARIVRAEVLVARRAEYAQAARLLGYGHARVMLRHILPNVITPAIIFMMSDVVLTILAVTSLGFLGLGIQPPTPEWGLMIAEGRTFLQDAWWISVFPGLAIVYVGITFTVLGEGLDDFLRAEGMNAAAGSSLLEVDDLRVRFTTPSLDLTAVDGVSFGIEAGEVFGLVGESGCGKTVTCRALIRLFGGSPPSAIGGTVRFAGRDLATLDERAWSALRGSEVSMIFQDPMTSLNPTMRVGTQIAEGLQRHRGLTAREARAAAIEMLAAVGVSAAERRHLDYPHAFSGGMRQRVLIAIALACRPRLLIADEPTTALDVTVQDQILKLILKLRSDIGMSVLLVTHDIGVIAQTCDRVAVMYAGKIVESGTTAQVVSRPAHPYTRALLAALPAHTRRGDPLRPIDGEPPNLAAPPAGCRFHPRCTFAVAACREVVPTPIEVEAGHRSACLRAGEIG